MNLRTRVAAIMTVVAITFLNIKICFAEEAFESQIMPVLMYHNIAEEYPEETVGANITPKLFEEHMVAVLERGYTPVLIKDYYECVQKGKALPDNPIAITFDDGYLSNYEVAYPILKKLNIPATIFIVTSTVGATAESGEVSYPHFTWEQAREMQESGIIDIHSHSHTHKNISAMTPAEMQIELRMSKYLIERNLNKNCFIFAYPFGGYDKTTSSLAKYAGYRMQILVNDQSSKEDYLANRLIDGLSTFTRLTVSGDMSVEDLFGRIDVAVDNTRGY